MVPLAVQGDEGYTCSNRVWVWAQDVAHGCWRMISGWEWSLARCRAATRGKWRPTVSMCHRSRAR